MKKAASNNLAKKMVIALVLGIIAGLAMILLRESLNNGGKAETWTAINSFLFADISAAGNEKAIGLFYVIGQLFVRAMQVVIVPMVFTSIVGAMIRISDARKLGRISSKTIGLFMATTVGGIILAAIVGFSAYSAGAFSNPLSDLTASTGATGSNPLMIIINAVPSNIVSAFTNNSGVLAIVIAAVGVGLGINAVKDKITALPKLCEEISELVTVILGFVVNKFGPIAIFCLLTRTFAAYGIQYLKPAAMYMILAIGVQLVWLFIFYPILMRVTTGLNPKRFIQKMGKVALFGFSTSSSAATLPLNMKTTVEELGVDEDIASFVLPLGMTVNMDGTAIMQTIAALFIAGCAGYEVSFVSLIVIGLLAIVASIGTPAAPGAGAVVLFTILSGVGFTSEPALMAYTMILAINRPIEMLVTALNVVGDTTTAMAVAKSEGQLDLDKYNAPAK